jgi:hypothetical protein
VHEDEVTEVHIGFPCRKGLLTNLRQTEHRLESRPIALLEGRESQFAGVANEDHPTHDAHHVLGLLGSLQVTVGLAHLGEGMRARHANGIRLHALRKQASPLVPADTHLLGQVDLGYLGRSGVTHPARLPSAAVPANQESPVARSAKSEAGEIAA